MDPVLISVFGLVYLGMFLGELPGLKLDRTGIALLGAIALVTTDRIHLDDAWAAIDVATTCLLLGLMVVSAQFRLAGFYTAVTRKLGAAEHSPGVLLALIVGTAGLLSAVLANDIVCLAMTPVLIELCARRRLNPIPYLLALACASNVGSAATLIGNPQNMLIGEVLDLSFAGFLLHGGVPALGGLVLVWAVIRWAYRGRWTGNIPMPEISAPGFNRLQTIKGLVVVGAVLIAFLWAPWPRAVVALTAAGVLMISRETASRELLGLVDWHLLLLFAGLFVVNAAVAQSGLLGGVFMAVRMAGIDIGHPAALFGITAVLSNLVSNVPAVLLLLPAAGHPLSGPVLALSSTLAGNLLIVGSIANVIVVDQAHRHGIVVDWRMHARIGIPVTLTTLTLAALWLWLIASRTSAP
jgi:Na+/H+ antiporter NhaD/arsenite permease-like protein